MRTGLKEPWDPLAYRQVGGDANPVTYGGQFYRPPAEDDDTVEVIILQRVAEYVGEKDAMTVKYPFWVKSTTASREDVQRLFSDKKWRRSTGIEESGVELPDPFRAPWSTIASYVAEDEGIRSLGWDEEEGDRSGKGIYRRYRLVDSEGRSLEADLLEADEEHAALRGSATKGGGSRERGAGSRALPAIDLDQLLGPRDRGFRYTIVERFVDEGFSADPDDYRDRDPNRPVGRVLYARLVAELDPRLVPRGHKGRRLPGQAAEPMHWAMPEPVALATAPTPKDLQEWEGRAAVQVDVWGVRQGRT